MRFTFITLLAATTSTLAATVPSSCFWCVSTGQFWEAHAKVCKKAKSATTFKEPVQCTSGELYLS